MHSKDIVLGEIYRLKTSPRYGYVRPVEILSPGQGDNKTKAILVRCEHIIYPNDTVGLIKYFRVSDIIKTGDKG